jgi:hypothetical protein
MTGMPQTPRAPVPDLVVELNLRAGPPALHEQARQAFRDGDALGFVCAAGNNTAELALVFDNIHALQARGIYEPALLAALTGTRTNHHRWALGVLRLLLELADRDRLRAAGGPLPPGDPVRLYRGVAGRPRHRHICGLSWTTNLDRAVRFATRLALDDPAVYLADIPAAAIWAATDDRQEAECIVLVPRGLHVRRIRLGAP